MKIVGAQIQQIVGTYIKPNGKAPSAGNTTAPEDRVSVSERAGQILKARQAYDRLPEVRESRIAEIGAKLQDGTYRPDNARIADAILARGGGRSGPSQE